MTTKKARLLDPSAITLEDVLNESSSDSDDEDLKRILDNKPRAENLKQSLATAKSEVLADDLSSDLSDDAPPADALPRTSKAVSLKEAASEMNNLGSFKDDKQREDFIDNIVNEIDGTDSDFSSEDISDDELLKKKPRARGGVSNNGLTIKSGANKIDPKEIAKTADLITIVEVNEKINELQEKTAESESQLLSFNKDYYNVKKELILYSSFAHISHKLYEMKDHKYFGIVSCVRMYDNYFFVGNSAGKIRVFDVKTNKEMKPLIDETVDRVKVTSIDITEDGAFLVSGYKKGQLIVWDLQKYKQIRIINDAHIGEVTNCQIFHVSEEGTINIVSAEDVGKVKFIEVTKGGIFGNYNHNVYNLIDKRLKGTASIAVHRPSNIYPSPYCDKRSIIAFGAVNEVLISSMRPIESLFNLKKPKMVKDNKVPYLDWGFGLTPKARDRTVNILAIAWDCLIQLVYINEENDKVTIQFDGYYLTEQQEEINSVYFMGDSVLVALINSKEQRVLYTPKFQPGAFEYLDRAPDKVTFNVSFQQILDNMKYCELEKGHQIQEIRASIIQSHSVMNFNNTVTRFKKNILFVGNKQITRARLLSWREYLEKLKFTDNYDWLTVLKAALEIYNGDVKGFAKVPDEKELRVKFLKNYMKDMIVDSVKMVIYNFQKKEARSQSTDEDTRSRTSSTDSNKTSVDSIAIKVAIEFCLQIGEPQFLFGEVLEIFSQNNLKDKFIYHLEPFILNGQMRNEKIPEPVIRKLIRQYENNQQFKTLEKIIQQLDLSTYSQREDLIVLCQHNCMVSALLYLFTSCKSKDQEDEQNGCMQILNTMYKMMIQTKDNEMIIQRKETMFKQAGIEEIRLLMIVDSQKKYEIEKSYCYIGYKLFWIIKMFLEGKKFPYGQLSDEQHRAHVYDIMHFVTTQEYLEEVILFDSGTFFNVISRLFYGKPWKYFTENSKYFDTPIQPWDMLAKFEDQALRNNFQVNVEGASNSFYNFILQIMVAQNKSVQKWREIGECSLEEEAAPKVMDLEYQVVLKAVLAVMSPKQEDQFEELSRNAVESIVQVNRTSKNLKGMSKTQSVETQGKSKDDEQDETKLKSAFDEDLIKDALQAMDFKKEDVDQMFSILDLHTDRPYLEVRIRLYENKKDYVEAFKLHFVCSTMKKKVFPWIESRLTQLIDKEVEYQNEVVQQKEDQMLQTKDKVKAGGMMDMDAALKKALEDSSSDDEDLFNPLQRRGTVREGAKENQYKEVIVGGEKAEETTADQNEEKEFKPYPPLVNLKNAIKSQMKDLAQLNITKTRNLVNAFFREGTYQEHLILVDLARFPAIQYDYLLNYLMNQEDEIVKTIKDSLYQAESQPLANKYRTFLVLFVRLLCEFNKKDVEFWVTKEYFPLQECIEVCRNMKHDAGEAALMFRSGDYLTAIRIYLRYLEKIDVKTMQDHMAAKDSRANVGSSPEWDVGKVSAFVGGISLFDEVLEKACKIAEMKINGVPACGEEGWFLVLEYLQDYVIGARIKCANAFPDDTQSGFIRNKQVKSYLASSRIPFEVKVERLKDFVIKRTNAILRREDLHLSLKSIMDKLNLEFLQIQKLYDFKVKKMSEVKRLLDVSVKVQKNDLNIMFDGVDKEQASGFNVNPGTSAVFHLVDSPVPKCSYCSKTLVEQKQAAVKMFVCGHKFHRDCLHGCNFCITCGKSYFDIAHELKKRERRFRDKGNHHSDSDSDGDNQSEKQSNYSDHEIDYKQQSENLRLKKLSFFDQEQTAGYLQTKDFSKVDHALMKRKMGHNLIKALLKMSYKREVSDDEVSKVLSGQGLKQTLTSSDAKKQ